MVFLSLIIPVYNERARLVVGVSTIIRYLKKQRYSWECIVVDDGSDVPASTLIDQEKYRIRIIRLAKNQGKGAAIAAGVSRAKGRYIVFSDIDLSVPIERLKDILGVLDGRASSAGAEVVAKFSCSQLAPPTRGNFVFFTIKHLIMRAFSHFISGETCENFTPPRASDRGTSLLLSPAINAYDIVIASRRCPDSQILVHQSAIREFSGRIFTFLSNIMCTVDVSDATCGFKGFRRDVAKRLFAKAKIKRWVFDTEILFLARKYGYSIVELPVSWRNEKGSKVRFFDSFWSFIDLLRIAVYDARGRYK